MGFTLMSKARICLKHLNPLFHQGSSGVFAVSKSAKMPPAAARSLCTKGPNPGGRPLSNNRQTDRRTSGQTDRLGGINNRTIRHREEEWQGGDSMTLRLKTSFPKSVFAAGTAKRTSQMLRRKAASPDEEEEEEEEPAARRDRGTGKMEPPDRPLSVTEWRKLKEASPHPQRFDVYMMNALFISRAGLDIAKSLLTFVAMETGTLSYQLLLRYLTLCVSGGHDAEVPDIYKIMQGNFQSLDTGASSLFIKSFSRTGRWREALSILQDVNKVLTPSPRNYGHVIAGAVLDGSTATAWALYDEVMEKGLSPHQETWDSLFTGGMRARGEEKEEDRAGAEVMSQSEYQERLLSILLYMRNNQVYPQQSLASSINAWFESLPEQNWRGSWTTVTAKGMCKCCGSELESIQLTTEEYQQLKDRVMTDIIQGRDVFKKTTPEDDRDAFYVCDLGDVLKKHLRWARAMPRVTPFYAVKCNDSRTVVMTLASLGAGFDCASKMEIQLVQSLGVDPSRIIYANPCKQASQIKYASAHGVQMMTFDSEVELMKVARCHDNAKLVLRIATDDSKAVCRLSVKFGATLKACRGLLERAKELGLDVIGVSFHVGSGCTDPDTYYQAISDARYVFDIADELGFCMNLLDIGGGFPGSDGAKLKFEEITAVINPALDKYFPADSGVRVIAEPGRYYVASAYTLAVNIIAKKVIMNEQSTSDEEDDGANDRTLMYYVNDGVYGSFNCILYDHAHCLPTLHKKPKPDELMYPCSIWGPTCDGLDRIEEQCSLPDLQVGDWLLFENMGAYTVAAASTFNGFQRPDIHYVISRPAWQHVQQICTQGLLPAPVEESCLAGVPGCCGRESGVEMPTKPCQTHMV